MLTSPTPRLQVEVVDEFGKTVLSQTLGLTNNVAASDAKSQRGIVIQDGFLELRDMTEVVTITDVLGREVLKSHQTTRLDLRQLPPALYFYSLNDGPPKRMLVSHR